MLSSLHHSISASFRGGCRPQHAALAVGLGLIAGFTTGWNLSLALLVLLAVLLNLQVRLLLSSWAAGVAFSWLASGTTYRIGLWLLDETPLGPALGALGDNFWVALLGWDQYCLAGGAVVGCLLALPAAKMTARLAPSLAAADDGNGDASARWLRPNWLLSSSFLIALAGAAAWWLGPELAKREMLRQLAAMNGAPVEAGETHLSIWTGELQMKDLQLVDPARRDRDRLRIGSASTRLNPGALLRGRVAADKLTIEIVRVDIARRQAVDARPSLSSSSPFSYSQPSTTSPAVNVEEMELGHYVRNWAEFRERLSWLGRLVAGMEQLAAWELPEEAAKSQAAKLRSDLGRVQPRVSIKLIRAESLSPTWGLGRNAALEIANVSSQPASLEQPTRLDIIAPELDTEISAEFKLRERSPRHNLRVSAYDCQLTELAEPAAASQAVAISSGKLDLQGEGWMTRERIELNLQFDSKPLEVRVASHEQLAGIEGAVWDQGLRTLGGLRCEARLAGPWVAPVLSINTRRVAEQFKHQLRAAGEHNLVRSIEEQLAHPQSTETPPQQVADKATTGASENEFCTVTDDSPVETVTNPFEGWRRARAKPDVAEAPAATEAAPFLYPRTSAPDTDPADRFLAGLRSLDHRPQKSRAGEQAEHETGALVERAQYAHVEATAAAPPPPVRAPGSRTLPGPINLVVGQQEAPPVPAAQQPDWPENNELPSEPNGQATRTRREGVLSRWATNMRDKFGFGAPRRKAEDEWTLPPEIDPQPEVEAEQPVDLPTQPAEEPPSQARRPWLPSLWR